MLESHKTFRYISSAYNKQREQIRSMLSLVFPCFCTTDDTATVTVTPTANLLSFEDGDNAVFAVKLDSRPYASVTFDLSSTDASEGKLSCSSLTFVAARWYVFQTVTVTGVDDVWVDGNITYQIITSAVESSDTNYNGATVADVFATNVDGKAPKSLKLCRR